MNSPSEVSRNAAGGAIALLSTAGSLAAGNLVELLEFRSLARGEELPRARPGGNPKPHAGKPAPNPGLASALEFGGASGVAAEAEAAALEAAARDALKTAREEGLQAGEREGQRKARMEMQAEMQANLERERTRLVGVTKEFAEARATYFTNVEQEVVKLALAIAARVLHREAQFDGLLLAGAVRVALEKMVERSGVVLRTAETDVAAWELTFRETDLAERPRVVGDARLERGDCVLETKMGTVELGVTAQLEEIEKGFFDLLNHRPAR